MNTVANIGVAAFAVMVALDAVGLLVDLASMLVGMPTITSYVAHHPWASVPIIGLQFAGVFGLCCHFLLRVDNG